VLSAAAKRDHGAADFREFNAASEAEFREVFGPRRCDPANNELAPAAAVAVARSLGLTPRDAFVDLGCSAGSLVLATAASTAVGRAHGVELSPRSYDLCEEARQRYAARFPGGGDRVAFSCGDLREADLAPYSVLYCAIRGAASRPRVMDELLERLCASAGGRRLVCAGFGVDLAGKPYEARVDLASALVLRRPEAEATAAPYAQALPLYGEGEGPRVLLEYRIAPSKS